MVAVTYKGMVLKRLVKWMLWGVVLHGLLSVATAAQPPDWNDAAIEWNGYTQGMKIAKQNNRPVMMIFYADWCPTCHAYKNIFYKPSVISLAKKLVMIKVNVDQYPQLSQQFEYDGSYVPRTFVMSGDGVLFDALYSEKRYKYFIKSQDVERFEKLMAAALAQAGQKSR